jgi:hypothetical protein
MDTVLSNSEINMAHRDNVSRSSPKAFSLQKRKKYASKDYPEDLWKATGHLIQGTILAFSFLELCLIKQDPFFKASEHPFRDLALKRLSRNRVRLRRAPILRLMDALDTLLKAQPWKSVPESRLIKRNTLFESSGYSFQGSEKSVPTLLS